MGFQIIPIAEADVVSLMKSIDKVIINPIIFFLFALAMVYFLYGLAQYLLSPDSEEVRKKSKSVMLWGIIGLFIMVAVFGIMKLILGTFKVNNIKINSNGDYVVEDNAKDIADRAFINHPGDNTDQFKGEINISNQDVPQLSASDFLDPFPLYLEDKMCWHSPVHEKATLEAEALKLAKAKARIAFLKDNNLPNKDAKFEESKKVYMTGEALAKFYKDNGITDEDIKNQNYPSIFDTKILYDKKNKEYHAWIDARRHTKDGTDKNCDLKIVKPARTLKDGIISTNLSIGDTKIYPIEMFNVSPFPTYEDSKMCWHKPLYGTAKTEFEALQVIKTGSRKKFLDLNPTILDTDENNKKYPMTFDTKVLYDKKNGDYYYWFDNRAPLLALGGTEADCNKLKVLKQARIIPDGVVPINVSVKDTPELPPDTFITIPFAKYYENPKCWHRPIKDKADTEYLAIQLAKVAARNKFLEETHISATDKKYIDLPKVFESKLLYDKLNKLYYSWIDARAPINGGLPTSCDLKVLALAQVLPDRTGMSGKPDPFGTNFESDESFYRIHDSSVNHVYLTARSRAIDNALIQVAKDKGLNTIRGLNYRILSELYYPYDLDVGTYDYWVVIESPK